MRELLIGNYIEILVLILSLALVVIPLNWEVRKKSGRPAKRFFSKIKSFKKSIQPSGWITLLILLGLLVLGAVNLRNKADKESERTAMLGKIKNMSTQQLKNDKKMALALDAQKKGIYKLAQQETRDELLKKLAIDAYSEASDSRVLLDKQWESSLDQRVQKKAQTLTEAKNYDSEIAHNYNMKWEVFTRYVYESFKSKVFTIHNLKKWEYKERGDFSQWVAAHEQKRDMSYSLKEINLMSPKGGSLRIDLKKSLVRGGNATDAALRIWINTSIGTSDCFYLSYGVEKTKLQSKEKFGSANSKTFQKYTEKFPMDDKDFLESIEKQMQKAFEYWLVAETTVADK